MSSCTYTDHPFPIRHRYSTGRMFPHPTCEDIEDVHDVGTGILVAARTPRVPLFWSGSPRIHEETDDKRQDRSRLFNTGQHPAKPRPASSVCPNLSPQTNSASRLHRLCAALRFRRSSTLFPTPPRIASPSPILRMSASLTGSARLIGQRDEFCSPSPRHY